VRVAVVGAGAIGGFIAAALARSGADVSLVARGAHLAAIREGGLRVTSELGDFTASLPASDSLGDLGAFDVLLLTFKAHQWPSFIEQLEPHARAGATIVTLQNGLPFWFVREPPLQCVDPGGRIGAMFPDAQVIGGVVHSSGSVRAPGTIHQSGGMRYPLGDPGGGARPAVLRLCDMLRLAGLAPEPDPNIRATVWLKLVNNVGLNAVSAMTGKTIGIMLADASLQNDVRTLMGEALAVGRAIGVVDDVDIDARIAYAARLADVKTSMLQDVEAGRALELDPILGAVIELAGRHGIAVPRVAEAYTALRRLAP
jgi:2-dehydropantoate 2-reductase